MTDTAVAPPRSQNIWGRVGGFLVARPESTIAIVALALATYFAVVNPAFLTTANIRVISQYMIATAILAAGQVMLLISGEIDLSMGNVYFMTPFLVFFASEAGLVLPLAILVGVLGAGVVGYLNGAISLGFGIPSFIVTLGMGFVINGFTLNISDGFPKRVPSTGVGRRHLWGRQLLRVDVGDHHRDRDAPDPQPLPMGGLHGRCRRQPPGCERRPVSRAGGSRCGTSSSPRCWPASPG